MELENNGIDVYIFKDLLEIRDSKLIFEDLELYVDFIISFIGVVFELGLVV